MHRFLSRTTVLISAACAAASLAIPSTASAIIAGTESNGLLINSNATPAGQDAELARAQDEGVHIIRANAGWSEIAAGCAGRTPAQLGDPDNGCYNWSVLDSLVSLAHARKIDVLLSTSGVPNWVQAKGCAAVVGRCYYMGTSQPEFNNTYKAYAAFMHAAGARYKSGSSHGTIKYWTIWNEPNSDDFWKPKPNAARYAQLYGNAAVQLKAAFPGAKVAVGPTGPRGHFEPNKSDVTVRPGNFIKVFQANLPKFLPKVGARKYIDAWAHNPYPLVLMAQPSKAVAAVKMPVIGLNNINDLFTLLDSKPITKGLPVWATEFGWETSPDEGDPLLAISRNRQAQMVGEAYDKLSRTKRVQIGIWYGLTDGPLVNAHDPKHPKMVSDWQAGTWTLAGVAKPSFYMYQRPISVPMGNVKKGTTVAVWGKSNLKPSSGKLVWCTMKCTTTKAAWHWMTGTTRNKDGDISGAFKVTAAATYFAVYDGQTSVSNGYGSLRVVLAH